MTRQQLDEHIKTLIEVTGVGIKLLFVLGLHVKAYTWIGLGTVDGINWHFLGYAAAIVAGIVDVVLIAFVTDKVRIKYRQWVKADPDKPVIETFIKKREAKPEAGQLTMTTSGGELSESG